MYRQNETRTAFTLAEVLITIGIIGVVAAMVIPNLVHNVEEKGWMTSSAVFERKLEESLRVMNTADQLAGSQTTEEFVEKLGKYMKISKTCDNNNLNKCFKENFVDAEKHEIRLQELKTARQMAVSDYGTNTIGVMFTNGVSAILAYDPQCAATPYNSSFAVMGCVSLIYDTNGIGRPNQLSKDMHTINASNNIGVIATINGVKVTSVAKAGTFATVDCKNTSGPDYKYCEYSTYTSTDYWAGASKYCGGKGNMATDDDLLNIAKYVYNNDTIAKTGVVSDLKPVTDRVTELMGYGFPNVHSGFTVYSSHNYIDSSNSHAFGRTFSTSSTSGNSISLLNRSYPKMAVCVKH